VRLTNPRTAEQQLAANVAPDILPAVPEGGALAGSVFKNVKVLSGLGVGEFTRTMMAITAWVAPKEGCNYCHKVGEDLAADTLYTKIVARRMLQMTQTLNSEWKAHVSVGGTGVTCYTCHRGQAVPQNTWVLPAANKQATRMIGNDAGQNRASVQVGLTAMPYDPFSTFLAGTKDIRVVSTTALPAGSKRTIKDTESTYALMVHISDGLGVNCTHCHNSQSFSSWTASTPQRVQAWEGIRMTRELNNAFLEPLAPVFPPNRKGPNGDVAKANCATCHMGANKPLLGAQMAAHYPGLLGPTVFARKAAR
jgi:photosynthetic reaction center cytochrome c subunit